MGERRQPHVEQGTSGSSHSTGNRTDVENAQNGNNTAAFTAEKGRERVNLRAIYYV